MRWLYSSHGHSSSSASQTNSPARVHVQYIPYSVLAKVLQSRYTSSQYIHNGKERKGNVLFDLALNTFYLRLYGVGHMVNDLSDSETRCRHIGYSFRITARVLLYAPSHKQDSTYLGLCYTSRGALAGTRNSSMGPPHEGSIRRPIAP